MRQNAPEASAALHPRRVRSFVLREGRITPAQAQALDRLWPRYGVALEEAGDVQARFARPAPLVLEIGFGNGEATLWRAQRDPDRNYLGIEVHRPGVGRLMRRAEAEGVDNLRVARCDGVEFLAAMPEQSIDTCIIEFPDPWTKKRHHKRRLIQPEFLTLLSDKLVHGGRLQLATDWADYAEHMLAVCGEAPGLSNAAGEGYAPRPDSRPPTHFEQRGIARGHDVFDLDFRRV